MSGKRIEDEGDIASVVSSHRYGEIEPYKVAKPPNQSLVDEFKYTFKEIFFHNNPFRPFKDKSKLKKFQLGIQVLFPILEWGRGYELHMLKGDLIAGLTIASLCIPQDVAYAKLANLDPQFGLYSSFVPPLIYAIMGSSRDIAIGPVAVVSLLLGTMIQHEFDPNKQKVEYQRLVFTATFFGGITQFTLGFFRMGFLIDFLSHAAIVGFMGGAAITISLQQLKGLLGIKTSQFTKKTDIVSVMRSVWTTVHHGWNWETILIGVSFLAFLLLAKYSIGKRNRKYFCVPVIAPLISVLVSTLVCIFHAEKKGVQIVQRIEKGINPLSFDKIYFTGTYAGKGFKIGVIAGLVGLTEDIAIGRTFAAMKDYHLDGNTEMVALGTMNVIGSMTSCYLATGSFSRSAVNHMAGCNSAVSNIVMSFVVLLALGVITPLFKYTPNATLAAMIISAVVALFDYEAMLAIWKVDKFDFLACIGTLFGVIFTGVEIGLIITISISFAKIMFHATRPRIALLGNIPSTVFYRSIQQYPDATKVPGLLIVRVDSAIYFTNANYIRERIMRLLTDEEEELKDTKQKLHSLIIEMSPVTDIDTSGIHALKDLHRALKKRDIELVLVNPGQTVLEKLYVSDFANKVGDDKIFLTVADAVAILAPKMET